MPASFDNDQFLELAKKWPGSVLQYLHKHLYHKLVHISQQRTNNRQASEDIVQEVLIDFWKKIDSHTKKNDFLVAPYLLMLVRKKSISYYHRSSITKNLPPETLDSLISSLPSAEELLFTTDAQHQLRVLVARLPRRERECVRLRYFEGMSNDAIATTLRVSKKTVERRLTAGIRQLRKLAGPHK